MGSVAVTALAAGLAASPELPDAWKAWEREDATDAAGIAVEASDTHERRDLNFFIDSGLVSLHPDGMGGLRQAAFWCTRQHTQEWGVDLDGRSRRAIEYPLPVCLGGLEQTGLLALARRSDPVKPLGGVRIDGLLGHAFVNRYSWTIDLDNRTCIFGVHSEEA